jgi:hypothetical protein
MRSFRGIVVATAMTFALWGVAPATAHAAAKKQTIQVQIVDQDGGRLPGATAVACPVVGGQQDCSQRITATANPMGIAQLKLDATVVYGVFAAVVDPQPAWACPGLVVDGQELYLSNRIEAIGSAIPKSVTFKISRPSPLDCVAVAVVDDSNGVALTGAGLFVCAHAPGDTACVGDRFAGSDSDGIIRMVVDDTLDYDLGTFITNTGWPCPWINPDDGTEFHFGAFPNTTTYTASQLVAGVTLTIHHPSAAECAPPPTPTVVSVVDDANGETLLFAGLLVCAHTPGSAECGGTSVEGPDADGVIRFVVDESLDYDLNAFITNTGWPCPWISPDDGTPFHFGPIATYTASQLLTGVTLTVHHPSAAECAE